MFNGFLSFKIFQHSCVVLVLLVCVVSFHLTPERAFAQGLPGGGGSSGLAASGGATAERLKAGKAGKNDYRVDPGNAQGAAFSEAQVLFNMRTLFDKILTKGDFISRNKNIDEFFSPHLRDAQIDMGARILETDSPFGRAAAGSPNPWSFWGCYGACPVCDWPHPHHMTGECCSVSTAAYAGKVLDTNFKACCVRLEDQNATMEEIACRHPAGDGWAGLFEYYFPTNVIGWESQRATTMIASTQSVKACLDASDSLMENSSWVAQAIRKGGGGGDGSIESKAQNAIKDIRPKDRSLRFSDTLQGGGLTMRVNFAHMDPQERKALARYFCMHEDQFMKLMDPAWDRLQMGGGPTLAALQAIPMWANYCPNAVKLMTDVNQTRMFIDNGDRTPTDFRRGMRAWDADPLYCQKMNVTRNPKGGEFLKDGVFKNSANTPYTEEGVGYTCRTGDATEGGFSTRMVPVELHSTAQIDQRTPDHAIAFMIAGGYYREGMYNGYQSFYKRFEPMPYSQKFNLFSGKKWEGNGPSEMLTQPWCLGVEGKNYEGKNQADQLFISDVNHKPFTQEQVQEFNKYDREWADKQGENFHNRNFGKSVLNYAAGFRIFATCPAGYVRWRGDHSEAFADKCGEEHFGGMNFGVQ